MPFTLPNFNLACDVYTGPWATKVYRVTLSCNLAIGRRVQQVRVTDDNNESTYGAQASLLVPSLSDIRDGSCNLVNDFVEVPQGSGRWYVVMLVDDVGKGFANEYRMVTIGKIWQGVGGVGSYPGLFWPTPIP